MNSLFNDTFDNFSFSTSARVIKHTNYETNTQFAYGTSISSQDFNIIEEKEGNSASIGTISFDDSAFLTGSFSIPEETRQSLIRRSNEDLFDCSENGCDIFNEFEDVLNFSHTIVTDEAKVNEDDVHIDGISNTNTKSNVIEENVALNTADVMEFKNDELKCDIRVETNDFNIKKSDRCQNLSVDSDLFEGIDEFTDFTLNSEVTKNKTVQDFNLKINNKDIEHNENIIKEDLFKQNESQVSKASDVQIEQNEVICKQTTREDIIMVNERNDQIIDENVSEKCTERGEESSQQTEKTTQKAVLSCDLSDWNLPQTILKKYEKNNVKSMFEWQTECLSNEEILHKNKNLVYSAPTSAGKTLVAEILGIKTLIERNKKVIFVLPFVSVVREKMFHFQDLLGTSGIRVEGFMGSYHPPGGFKTVQLAICTIEKANSLINRLLEDGELHDIGAVIIDEMHLLGDESRGYLLELLLTKLKYMSKKNQELQIQIIGMSATLPNLDVLARWLDAELFTTTFRPIPLYELCHMNGDIYDNNLRLIRKLPVIPELETDTDNILQLCLETIKNSCSVLIFCPTKNWCENLSQQISLAIWKIGNSKTDLGNCLRKELNVQLITELLEQLKRCPVGLDAILKKTVSFAVAFHHAGLTMDERDIIEGGFRSGGVRILVATSTLSSGVNLPARRVIVRSPKFYGKAIDTLTYRQMIGRAGRMGKDTAGESLLICQKGDYEIVKELMSAKLDPVESCLQSGKLKRAILEVVASGVASTPEDVELFSNCTLLANENNLENPVEDAIKFLERNQFIRLQKIDDGTLKYVATSLAKACLSSSLPPEEGLTLFTELEKARQCFVLETELHLIYLVTPYSACNHWGTIDWMFFLTLWEKLPKSMKRVGELIGIRESFMVNSSRGANQKTSYQRLQIHKRFYTALALQDLVNEIPLNQVASKFNCSRGLLQSLQQSASTFAGMVTAFSKQLGWSSVELLISQFQDRLHFGINRDLLDLMRLPIMNGPRARTLYNAGFQTLVQLAAASPEVIENVLHKVLPFESENQREGESSYDADKRNKIRTVWVTGKRGLTEKDAAIMLVDDARRYLQLEMGLVDAKWDSSCDETKDSEELPENNQQNLQKDKSTEIEIVTEKCIQENIVTLKQTEDFIKEQTQKEIVLQKPTENSKSKDLQNSKNLCLEKNKDNIEKNTSSGNTERKDDMNRPNLKVISENTSDIQKDSINILSETVNAKCSNKPVNKSANKHNILYTHGKENKLEDNKNSKIGPIDSFEDKSKKVCVTVSSPNTKKDVYKYYKIGPVDSFDGESKKGCVAPSTPITENDAYKHCKLGSVESFQGESKKGCVAPFSPITKNDAYKHCKIGPVESFQGESKKDCVAPSSPITKNDAYKHCKSEPVESLQGELKKGCVAPSSPITKNDAYKHYKMRPFEDESKNGCVAPSSPITKNNKHSFEDKSIFVAPTSTITKNDVYKHCRLEPSFEDKLNCVASSSAITRNNAYKHCKIGSVESFEDKSKFVTLSSAIIKNDANKQCKIGAVESFEAESIFVASSDAITKNDSKSSIITKNDTKSSMVTTNDIACKDIVKDETKNNQVRNDIDRKISKSFNFSDTSLFESSFDTQDFQDKNLNKAITDLSKNDDLELKLSLEISDFPTNVSFINVSSTSTENTSSELIGSSQNNIVSVDSPLKFIELNNTSLRKRKFSENCLNSTTECVIETPTKKKKINNNKTKKTKRNIDPTFIISQDKTVYLERTQAEPINKLNLNQIDIVNVCDDTKLFETFNAELRTKNEISLAVACTEVQLNRPKIGMKLLKTPNVMEKKFSHGNKQIVGVSVSWGDNTAYFINFDSDKVDNDSKITLIKEVLNNQSLKVRMFDSKEHIRMLTLCLGVDFRSHIEDPKIGDWLLDPDAKEKNLQAMVVTYSPEAVQISQLAGISKGVGSVGLDIHNSVTPRMRSSVEAVVTWHLVHSVLNTLAELEMKLLHAYYIEMNSIEVLTKMELSGLGVNVSCLEKLSNTLMQQSFALERKAFEIAGRKFSFASSTDVAKVVGMYRGKRVSTNKQVLENNEHPIAAIVVQWRKINTILTNTIYPLLRIVKNDRIYGCCITHNATGRVSMHEPNLQNVPRTFEAINPVDNTTFTINCREAFQTKDRYTLLSADYSQLELRLLAHLSKDELLVSILNGNGDVFKNIAARLNNLSEEDVTDDLRQKAKQICYGIIYGMGIKGLAEQMQTIEEEAAVFLESFHRTYPAIKKYIRDVIDGCADHGYVETIAGRRRYLPNISHRNPAVKSQAERQAVNTTIQGSAADIAKNAMVLIDKMLKQKFRESKRMPQLVLQLHDEFLFEVPEKYIDIVAKIVKNCMENSVKLSVPFPVNVKSAKSWGTLQQKIL